MSKESEVSGDPNPDPVRAEAQRLLDEIKQFRTQAEEQFKAAEASRKNADSEGLFAINAKRTCEEHSTAISQLKGTVEAEVTSIVTNKQKFDELHSLLTASRPVVEADVKIISESRKDIEHASGKIKEGAEKGLSRLQEIEESKKSIDTFLREAEGLRDEAILAREKTNAAQLKAEELSTLANGFQIKISSEHQTSTRLREEINAILTTATTDRQSLTEIIGHLKETNEIADGFEKRIAKSSLELEALIKKADSLLPGFTSVSLASAFGKHKKRFNVPKILWIITFVLCIAGLVGVAYPSFIAAISATLPTKSWEELLRSLAMRLPIVIPLVWLAIYAGRNYMLSLRLEEDYAYKEAISTAFEGYKREMVSITQGQVTDPNPIATLCSNVLKAIAERPGRIYESKQQDMTPTAEAHAAAQKLLDFSQKQVASR